MCDSFYNIRVMGLGRIVLLEMHTSVFAFLSFILYNKCQ